MKNLIIKAKIAILTIGIAMISPLADAQSGVNLGQTLLDESTRGFKDIIDSIVSFAQVASGIGALVLLVIVGFQVMQGDRESAKKLAWWIAGLTLLFTLMTVLTGIISRA